MSSAPDITLTTRSATETVALGTALASSLRPGDVVALIGELGAGKTQLVRGIAAGLGAPPGTVSSPTFVLMQEYATKPPLIHIDAYRIRTLAEVQTLGWTPDLIEQSISVIEWADRIANDLPTDRLDITLQHINDTTREIALHGQGGWTKRLQTLQHLGTTPPPGQTKKLQPCPICSAATSPDSEFFPFCSHKCKMVDLGRWLGDKYRVTRDIDWEKDDLTAFDREED